jgi:hypothetical protein
MRSEREISREYFPAENAVGEGETPATRASWRDVGDVALRNPGTVPGPL